MGTSYGGVLQHPWVRKVGLGLVGVLVFLAVWQMLVATGLLKLPAPTRVFADTRELILHPFYRGTGNDAGIGWQILFSLRRVGVGFALAAVVGITVGMVLGASPVLRRL
ncbi:MAG: hypothetical protein Q6L55_06195 [Gloeomargarita sp. SRBZ-1_bins_9]